MTLPSLIVIGLALTLAFLNGVHGSSNIVATMISSRAFRPVTALAIAAVAEFLGPFLFGVAVAHTIGAELVRADAITMHILMAGIGGAIFWNLLNLTLGLPSSSSHGLAGGLLGATLLGAGAKALLMQGLIKVLVALFAAPLIGFGLGFIFMRVVLFFAQNASPNINGFFKNSQVLTALILIMSHSSNDAQKAMGLIGLSLVIGGTLPVFAVPTWVVTLSAASLALGASLGGWRLIRALGRRFYKIRPVHSFSSQVSSTLVLLCASWIGWPVSTTQVVSSAIIGVGSAERFGKVRWNMASEIVIAWLVTIPSAALVAAGLYWLIGYVIR